MDGLGGDKDKAKQRSVDRLCTRISKNIRISMRQSGVSQLPVICYSLVFFLCLSRSEVGGLLIRMQYGRRCAQRNRNERQLGKGGVCIGRGKRWLKRKKISLVKPAIRAEQRGGKINTGCQ
jgi:hypothetical protein